MSTLGRFLEFSVSTPDILDSLNFYKALGFRELNTTDAWPHKYAAVSDGLLHIGLHDREPAAAQITFTHPELAKHALSMSDRGFEFESMRLDDDAFHEVMLKDPCGHELTIVEARTFTADPEDDDDSLCGTLMEISLPTDDALRAAHFWGPVAQVVEQTREEPTCHMRFNAGGIPLGLSESLGLPKPGLAFRNQDMDALLNRVESLGARVQKHPGYEGATAVIVAPEGTLLYVFSEDFLGETIEVEESDDLSEFPGAD